MIVSENPHQENSGEGQQQPLPHKCRICGKSLAGRSRSTREFHVWKHIAKPVLQCRYCPKIYHAPHDSNLMNAHIRSAHPGRPPGHQVSCVCVFCEKCSVLICAYMKFYIEGMAKAVSVCIE